jgi:hypothetical protein
VENSGALPAVIKMVDGTNDRMCLSVGCFLLLPLILPELEAPAARPGLFHLRVWLAFARRVGSELAEHGRQGPDI